MRSEQYTNCAPAATAFSILDLTGDPRDIPPRPPRLPDDRCGPEHRFDDDPWFDEHPWRRFRWTSATAGDRRRAGVSPNPGERAVRFARREPEACAVLVLPEAVAKGLAWLGEHERAVLWDILGLEEMEVGYAG